MSTKNTMCFFAIPSFYLIRTIDRSIYLFSLSSSSLGFFKWNILHHFCFYLFFTPFFGAAAAYTYELIWWNRLGCLCAFSKMVKRVILIQRSLRYMCACDHTNTCSFIRLQPLSFPMIWCGEYNLILGSYSHMFYMYE